MYSHSSYQYFQQLWITLRDSTYLFYQFLEKESGTEIFPSKMFLGLPQADDVIS